MLLTFPHYPGESAGASTRSSLVFDVEQIQVRRPAVRPCCHFTATSLPFVIRDAKLAKLVCGRPHRGGTREGAPWGPGSAGVPSGSPSAACCKHRQASWWVSITLAGLLSAVP